ncbi:MAG: hypothetical protein GY816_17295 [Cytophagales bacterium]|nr:hypothetical protein [Cytophagales bacterium]
MRHIKRDPEGARNSIRYVLFKLSIGKVRKRLDWYESNTSIDTLKEVDLKLCSAY